MSDPKVIYLGPACQEQGQSSGREWCQDDVWDACECGHESVRYVLGAEFDQVTAERDALQQRLNAADQRNDELVALLLRSNELFYAIQGDPGAVPSSAIDAMRGEVFTALKPAAGSTCNQVREESGLPVNVPCQACGRGTCIDR